MQVDEPEAHERWLDGVLEEARQRSAEIAAPSTVYLGGGTPSALAPGTLEKLLDGLRDRLSLSLEPFVCLEANPEDVDGERVRAWRSLGIGMVSLGVQSLDREELRFLGRMHDGRQAQEAIERCLEAGFPIVSSDLIFGLPGQEREALAARITSMLALGIPHLSAYQLTIEAGTFFARARDGGRLVELGEPEQAALFFQLHESLQAGGLPAYEVSNFSRDRLHRSPHNPKYWQHLPYLGLGPGAHSFDGQRRSWNARSLGGWLQAVATAQGPEGEEKLGAAELALEALLLGFRQADGIDCAAFEERFGLDLLSREGARFEGWQEEGFIERVDSLIRPTTAGFAIADGLAAAIDLECLERA